MNNKMITIPYADAIEYGETIVPFKDDFPKGTQLYRIMTTRLEETVQN